MTLGRQQTAICKKRYFEIRHSNWQSVRQSWELPIHNVHTIKKWVILSMYCITCYIQCGHIKTWLRSYLLIRVDMVGWNHNELLTQGRHLLLGQIHANIFSIRTNSNYLWDPYLWASEVGICLHCVKSSLWFLPTMSTLTFIRGFTKFGIKVLWRLKFLDYLSPLTLKFQKARTKIKVVLTLPCWLSQLSSNAPETVDFTIPWYLKV